MIVLGLETASTVCSVAVLEGERTRALLSIYRPRAHAEHLVPMMADALRYAGTEPAAVDAVAVSSGPGSFTGLRIGVSTAKGFATATGARLVSIPTLRALAERVRPFAARNDLIAAALDARRNEAFAALFRARDDGTLAVERATTILTEADVESWLDVDGTPILTGSGWNAMRLDSIPHRRVWGDDALPSAETVARLGATKLARDETEDVVSFEPYYLKEFVATRPKATAFEKLSF